MVIGRLDPSFFKYKNGNVVRIVAVAAEELKIRATSGLTLQDGLRLFCIFEATEIGGKGEYFFNTLDSLFIGALPGKSKTPRLWPI